MRNIEIEKFQQINSGRTDSIRTEYSSNRGLLPPKIPKYYFDLDKIPDVSHHKKPSQIIDYKKLLEEPKPPAVKTPQPFN